MITAAAKGIVMSVDHTLLVENGGHIQLMNTWEQSLMVRMGLVKRKASTKKSRMTDEEFRQRKVYLSQAGWLFCQSLCYPSLFDD